jgi:hypothetical protein
LRLPALLAGLACVPLCYWVGYRWLGDRGARWATLLLALSPVHLWYSAEARLYTPMVLTTLLAFGTCDRLLAVRDDARAPRWLWPLHLLNVAVMLGLHYYLAVYVVVLAVLAPLLARGVTPAARRICLWHGIGILLLCGFVLGKRALGEFETAQDYLRQLTPGAFASFVLDWCWTGHTLTPIGRPLLTATAWLHQGLGATLLLLGAVALWRRRRDGHGSVLLAAGLLTLPLFLLGCGLVGYDRTYLERSMIPTLPFVLLLAGAGLGSLRPALQRSLGAATLGLAAVTLAAVQTFGSTHWTVYKPNSDWRAAAQWLGREIEQGGAGRPVFTSTPNPRSLSYYDPRIQDVKNLALPMAPADLGTKVTRRLGSWLGGVAEAVFTDFAAHNTALLQQAKLRVYRASSDPEQLQLGSRGSDGICYLVQDEWHPHRSVDPSVYDLLVHPRVQVLDSLRATGIQVHKVRILP